MYHSIYIMFRNKMKQKSIKWCSRGKTVVGEGGDSDWAFYSQARENSWPECWLHSAFSCRFPFWKVKIRAVLVCMIYFTLVKRSLQKISKSLFLCTVLESDLVNVCLCSDSCSVSYCLAETALLCRCKWIMQGPFPPQEVLKYWRIPLDIAF